MGGGRRKLTFPPPITLHPSRFILQRSRTKARGRPRRVCTVGASNQRIRRMAARIGGRRRRDVPAVKRDGNAHDASEAPGLPETRFLRVIEDKRGGFAD